MHIRWTRGLTSRRSQPPLALSVPLSRFTPRVGGGSAFFVRAQSDVHSAPVGLAGDFLHDIPHTSVDAFGVLGSAAQEVGGWRERLLYGVQFPFVAGRLRHGTPDWLESFRHDSGHLVHDFELLHELFLLLAQLRFQFFFHFVCLSVLRPNQSPEPTRLGAFSCSLRLQIVHVASPAWLSSEC